MNERQSGNKITSDKKSVMQEGTEKNEVRGGEECDARVEKRVQ